MKRLIPIFLLALVGFGAWKILKPKSYAAETETQTTTETVPQVRINIQSYTIQDGDVFTTAAEALGISYADALSIVETAAPIFDFTRVRVGKTIDLISEDGTPIRLEYEPDTERVISVDLQNAFTTTEQPIQYDVSLQNAEVTIDNSLYVSGLNAGMNEVLILNFAEVFAWEVDFATQVQRGDSMTVLYEERSRNGEIAGVGDILKGTFTNNGETYTAYRFVNTDGTTSYYNERGESLVRAFLKAPIPYSRITSGYTTSRFHPTLQKTMAHQAIDYAAPLGTPIVAVADGSVTMARWNGCFGNYIDVRHNSMYETQYAHLSKFAVTAGQHVKQGDVIGYTGTTGCSTGPHLHYQVRVNGELVNPLDVEFPAGDAIAEDQMAEFERQKAEIDAL